MRRGSPRWTVRVLLTATTLLGGVLCGAWLPSPTARAADPKSWVSISIDSMSPALPSRDGTIRLTGTVRNTSTEPLNRLQAVLWRSLDPISDDEGMDSALASASNEPLGSRVRPGRIFQNLPSDANRSLAAGQSTSFDLTADVDDFELPGDDAIYLIGVQVRGQVGASGDDEILGRGRIFMPLVGAGTSPEESDPQPDAQPGQPQLELATVVLLSSRPSLVRSGVLSDDHLAAEIGPTGRLRILLEAARRPSASFAVDPATIEELETMRRGYSVVARNGETTPGAGQAAAERWLTDFARLRVAGDGFRVLFGSPDLTALVHDSQRAVIDASAAAGNAVEATRSLPLVVLPTAGRADAATVTVADSLRPRAILLSESSAGGPRALLSGPGTTPIVSYSASSLAGGPGPAPSRTPVKIRQRALADSWLAAATADTNDAAPRVEVRLITSKEQADTLSQGSTKVTVPWIKPVTLTRVLAGQPAEWDEQFGYGSKATDAELSAGQLGKVRGLAAQFGTYADLLVDPARATSQAQVTLPRAASGQWRNADRAFSAYTRGVEQGLDQVLRNQVSISVPARVLTTGRDARFPITVYNNLPAVPEDPQVNSIRVVVRFQSANSQRLTVAPVELPPLPAGTNRTENVQVRAETNGSVQVTAELRTRSGRPVGQPVPVLVNATQAGTTGWIIALIAGVVLVGTTALRIRQVAKERSAQPDPEPVLVSRPPASSAEPAPGSPAEPAGPDAGRDRDPLDV